MSESKQQVKVQYGRPQQGEYPIRADGILVPECSVRKADGGGFDLEWHGARSWHRTMRAVVIYIAAAFAANVVKPPVARQAGNTADFSALAAAAKRARGSASSK